MRVGSAAFKAGAFVLKEGEPGSEMLVIESGTVEILPGPGGAEGKPRLLEPGDFFGEMALLDEGPRGASARAVTDCVILVIDATTLGEMFRSYPEVAVRMLRQLAGRLRAESARAERAEAALGAAAAAPSTAADAPGARSRALIPPGAAPIPLPDKDDVRLGRFDTASGLAPDIELGPLDTKHLTSRRHARLVREGGETFVLEEIATANGTFVNGVRIVTGVKTRVHDGDTLRFGGVDLVYRGD